MNLHTSKEIIAKAERLKKTQQTELPNVLKRNHAAAIRYDKLAVKIADFIHQEVIPTKNADLMLAVGLTFAQIELDANKNAPDRVKISLQNTVAQYEQAGFSRKENIRSLEAFKHHNAGYQAGQRTPRGDKFGLPVDAVHSLVASERARNNNAQTEPTLPDALRQERIAKIDLCNAILDQHKVEQRDWLTKLQARQPETEEERKDRELREEVSAALERARNDTSDPTVVKFNRNCDAIIEQSVSAFAEKIGLSPDGSAPSNTQSATLGQNTDKQKEPKDLSLPKKQSVSR